MSKYNVEVVLREGRSDRCASIKVTLNVLLVPHGIFPAFEMELVINPELLRMPISKLKASTGKPNDAELLTYTGIETDIAVLLMCGTMVGWNLLGELAKPQSSL